MARKKKNVNLVQEPIRKFAPIFILPTFLAFAVGFIWPFIQGIYLSFCNFNIPRDAKWVGLENYTKVFQDPGFINAFWNTAGFAVVSIVLINVVAFAIAYALTQKIRGANWFRTVFFMPNLIGGVVLGYIWSLIFDGILKNYGTYLTANGTYGFWGLVILVAWQQIGYMMIIYIAGLQALSEDMLEAAKMDGAKINVTELLALNIYSTYNISKNWHGVAQAKAVVFFILVAVLAIAQQAATRRKEVQ